MENQKYRKYNTKYISLGRKALIYRFILQQFANAAACKQFLTKLSEFSDGLPLKVELILSKIKQINMIVS